MTNKFPNLRSFFTIGGFRRLGRQPNHNKIGRNQVRQRKRRIKPGTLCVKLKVQGNEPLRPDFKATLSAISASIGRFDMSRVLGRDPAHNTDNFGEGRTDLEGTDKTRKQFRHVREHRRPDEHNATRRRRQTTILEIITRHRRLEYKSVQSYALSAAC